MDFTYMSNGSFWIAQFFFGAIFMFSRFPAELITWRITRSVRRAANKLNAIIADEDKQIADADLRRVQEIEGDFHDAPRLLRPFYAYKFVRAVKHTCATASRSSSDGSSGGDVEVEERSNEQSTAGTTTLAEPSSDVFATPDVTAASTNTVTTTVAGRQPASKTIEPTTHTRPLAEAPLKASRFAKQVESLCRWFTNLAARILGGEEGLDYGEEITGDLDAAKNQVFKLVYAISNVIGALRLRMILRTGPSWAEALNPHTVLRKLAHPRLLPRLVGFVDALLTSSLLAGTTTGFIDAATLIGIGAWSGMAVAYITAPPLVTLSCYGLKRLRAVWQERRVSRQSET